MHVAADERDLAKLAVGHRRRTVGRHARWHIYGEAAIRTLDRHRLDDLGRVDADARQRPGQPDPIDGYVKTGHAISASTTGSASAPRSSPAPARFRARPTSAGRP